MSGNELILGLWVILEFLGLLVCFGVISSMEDEKPMIWNVYFEKNAILTKVGSASTYDDAVAIMNQKIKESGFKSYYTRVTKFSDAEFWFDYGSHTTFYWIRKEEI